MFLAKTYLGKNLWQTGTKYLGKSKKQMFACFCLGKYADYFDCPTESPLWDLVSMPGPSWIASDPLNHRAEILLKELYDSASPRIGKGQVKRERDSGTHTHRCVCIYILCIFMYIYMYIFVYLCTYVVISICASTIQSLGLSPGPAITTWCSTAGVKARIAWQREGGICPP